MKEEIKVLLLAGRSVREVMRLLGVKEGAVRGIRRQLTLPACKCGQAIGHRGWCAERLARCPRRREYLKALPELNKGNGFNWKGRKRSAADKANKSRAQIGIPKRGDPETIARCKRASLYERRFYHVQRLAIMYPAVRLDRKLERREIHEILLKLIAPTPDPCEALMQKEEWEEERKYWLWRWSRAA